MPRGKYYPEELREEARRLRKEGWSLGEIAAKLGPPKNTLSLANREARLARIELQQEKAKLFLVTLTDQQRINHVAAAMLYLAEGAKAEGAFAFGNSDPQVIRYWMYLLRTSFDIDESKLMTSLSAATLTHSRMG